MPEMLMNFSCRVWPTRCRPRRQRAKGVVCFTLPLTQRSGHGWHCRFQERSFEVSAKVYRVAA